VLRTATISIFISVAKCGSICRAQICAQSGVEPLRSAKAFLQGGPQIPKKEFLTISSFYVPYISATAKNRVLQAAYVAY